MHLLVRCSSAFVLLMSNALAYFDRSAASALWTLSSGLT